jgi:hypothetical protein
VAILDRFKEDKTDIRKELEESKRKEAETMVSLVSDLKT